MKVLAKAHRFITFTTPPNLQAAVAYGLAKDDDYFLGMRRDLQAARDRFAGGLAAAGLDVLPSRATYFLNIDLRSEEHTSELQSLMRISYAVFCLKKKNDDPRLLTSSTLSASSH